MAKTTTPKERMRLNMQKSDFRKPKHCFIT